MKVETLLAQFLYNNKQLDLQGIGSFTLDSVVMPDPVNKQKSPMFEGLSFQSNPSTAESAELIAFISSNTGKMKALAAADLNSHIELIQQFLNIGKPFLLEGIGSLVKIRSGQYEFTPGVMINERLKDFSSGSTREKAATIEGDTPFGSYHPKKVTSYKWLKPVILLLILVGIVLAIWGGYSIYQKNKKDQLPAAVDDQKKDNNALLANENKIATHVPNATTTITHTANSVYKFVIEDASKSRALQRFNTLKGFGLDIKMETRDSLQYKLYFLIPATAADTTRILDSLRIVYTPAGKRAYIDNK